MMMDDDDDDDEGEVGIDFFGGGREKKSVY